MKKRTLFVGMLLLSAIMFRIICGIFVVQPMGAIPEGVSIVYFRFGLNMPFIASADGILDEFGAGVSLLGRGLVFPMCQDSCLNQ
ncbi:hypothetical protein SAMN02746065_1221 [Desulfocicer vacuolatum DSM 3385]|uniref:Uncharacterized protein n=1 Tax=Desulfocicer vacuolatum DSM 3385 TaxID=1121400 RepID=A0A1W2DXB4_9BACT|nr:hypothetical protein [Desulfocicer vacuolatum]SMD02235.1 hypothetical protein SAMN02746065_1221 [Desulfocicer vacuolatum DSM 3385]